MGAGRNGGGGALEAVTWSGGRLVSPFDEVVAAADRGLLGDGVFEVVKVVAGVPFALDRHLRRLQVSAQALDLPVDLAEVEAGVETVLAADLVPCPRRWLRILVTAGPAGVATGEAPSAPSVIVTTSPMAEWGPAATTVVLPWRRNERGALAGLKTLSYLENGIGLRHARSLGADEGLFANTAGNLCEGTGTNVFVAVDGALVTPPLSAGCLAGVTRELLLEWAPEIVEADLPIEALEGCTEAFLTSTSRDVHPIGSIDGRRLPGADGPLTAQAAARFAEGAARLLDRAG